MSDPSTAIDAEAVLKTFDALDQTLRDSGPSAALDLLVQRLEARGDFRGLLDALLLKARHELGLPLVQLGGFSDFPEDKRTSYEERYVESIRAVGSKLLALGDIPGAWPYFRAIGEPDPVVRAIDVFEPADDDPRVAPVVEVAFNQGANPRRGFALILKHYGTCSAITAFEQLPRDEATRLAAADGLVRQLHEHLVSNLRGEIAQRGQPLPPERTTITDLIAGRDWLFSDESYHIDVSHLSATVRVSPLLADPATIALAAELTDYGRQLSTRLRYEGDTPFENVYADHGIYLKALLGQDVEAALAHFRSKLAPARVEVEVEAETEADVDLEFDAERREHDAAAVAQVLVGLLVRLGRIDEAIGVAAEHLAGIPEAALICPGVSQLCQRAGRPDRLAEIARDQGDLVNYTAALLQVGL